MGSTDNFASPEKLELGDVYQYYDIRDDPYAPHKFLFNTEWIKISIMGIDPVVQDSDSVGLIFNWTALDAAAPPPLPDGDARLIPGVTDRTLTESVGKIVFKAADWISKYNVPNQPRDQKLNATRARWTVYPSAGADAITLSFNVFKPSSADIIFIRSCFKHSLTQTLLFRDPTTGESRQKFVSSFGLRVQGDNIPWQAQLPCPVTVHEPCVQIDVDFGHRYYRNVITDRKLDSTEGFILQFSSVKGVVPLPAATVDVTYGCNPADKPAPR